MSAAVRLLQLGIVLFAVAFIALLAVLATGHARDVRGRWRDVPVEFGAGAKWR